MSDTTLGEVPATSTDGMIADSIIVIPDSAWTFRRGKFTSDGRCCTTLWRMLA
jgi:hypothetical protein